MACNLKAVSAIDGYRSAFVSWDQSASVRIAPNQSRILESTLFPESLVPEMKSKLVSCLDTKRKLALRQSALFRFLNFTHKLELLVVNPVTLNIALGRYNIGLSDEMRLDAHRIYTDEAYHALFSHEFMSRVKRNALPHVLISEATPKFIRHFEETILNSNTADRPFLQLFFVIISEMLITSTLAEAWNQEGMDKGISAMIKDHAVDEARHRAYYRSVFKVIWPTLSAEQRKLIIKNLPKAILFYTTPDETEITNGLLLVGLSPEESRQVYSETYSYHKNSTYAQACSLDIFLLFQEFAIGDELKLLKDISIWENI